jgi:hypothetical protein
MKLIKGVYITVVFYVHNRSGNKGEPNSSFGWHGYVKFVLILLNEALCYKLEGQTFESGHWIFSTYLILPTALGPGNYSASNRND